MRRLLLLGFAVLFSSALAARAQSLGEIELGAAAHPQSDAALSLGPSLTLELTPIHHWLELEAGESALFARHAHEWDTELIAKKGFDFSPRAEFMLGFGPAWIRGTEDSATTNSLAGEAALVFKYWPGPRHRFGWFLEPGYEYNFSPGREKSLTLVTGLVLALTRHPD